MKYYFYSAVLILLAIIIVVALPIVVRVTENELISFQIPQNSGSVAGVQKYIIPPLSKNIPHPSFSARAVLIKDLITGTILFQKDADVSFPIASTTKIMTALVSSEYFKPNSVLKVSEGAGVAGTKIGLTKGENFSFRSLLYGMLLSSGNDAAYTLAENYPGGTAFFISAMNNKALQLNLANTHFDNPAGFDSPKHYSSARDLSVITEEALKNSSLARIFATKETNIVSLDKKYKHDLINLNKLLTQVKGVLGVKTGYTEGAKENLITYIDRDGHQIIIVVLGSNDRFGESTALIEWAYQNFAWPEFGIVQ